MWSTVATSSASRRGWLSGRTWTAIPILTRRVQAASAEAMTSGAARTDRSFWKWISANHTALKPKSSAAFICASASSNAAASVTPGGLGNSVNRPNSIPPSRSNSVYPTPEHPVTGGQELGGALMPGDRVFDRSAEDIGNIILLEHVNVKIPDQVVATNFYVTALGLTRDPY